VEQRVKYWRVAPEGMGKMRELEHYVNSGSGLERNLMEMMRLLASSMNGCGYCVQFHTGELKKTNETPDRMAGVVEWRGSSLYTERERAALAWTEALTNIQDGHAPAAVYDEVRRHFSEVETVNLTLVVSTINAWNRIAISLGQHS
jgi:AhpD family alkylhydroperoxidase